MYCPKCKDNFEEGSRRFCPTDGSRLISEYANPDGNTSDGIFANLTRKSEPVHGSDKPLPEIPHFLTSEPKADLSAGVDQDPESDIFFDLDPMTTSAVESAFLQPKGPLTRKIQAFEIPAGHVDLSDVDRFIGVAAEFDGPESFVGSTVKGRYKVTEFLGGDESVFAFLADDKIVQDKQVLVSILLDDEKDEIVGSILTEERISLSHFSHPNIARLIDSGQFNNGTNFLISEYVDALSASDILKIHGHFGTERAARIIKQAANALNEAHQEGILHRDIRPDNLIVVTTDSETEQTKLVNFGLSNGEPTSQNAAYKAPEVLRGRISTIGSDVFSLAVIAYEMLTGQMPFRGSNAKEIVKSQQMQQPIPPSSFHADIAQPVDEIFKRALSFNGADRYPKARDFGDALYFALSERPTHVRVVIEQTDVLSDSALPPGPVAENGFYNRIKSEELTILRPAAEPSAADQPAQIEISRTKIFAGAGILALLSILGFGWYYVANSPASPSDGSQQSIMPVNANTDVPPPPRNVAQPPNTTFFQNDKQNLTGDLLENFVGFSVYYPNNWEVNRAQQDTSSDSRGKFLDISRSAPDGQVVEQMLVSYYPSNGTFAEDVGKFPELVKETNDTLRPLLPGYQMVSEGETNLNGGWRAYEIKFQAAGTTASGDKLTLWGRRLFIPAARPGLRGGYTITLLATSLSDTVRSVDEVGVKGELAAILESFEPSRDF